MPALRLFVLLLFVFMCFTVHGYSDMTSWVDKNGVRHYSNVNAPTGKATVQDMQEFKSKEGELRVRRKRDQRDRFGVLKIYEEDRIRRQQEKKRMEEMRRQGDEQKRRMEEYKKAARERQAEYCQAAKRKLYKLRKSGWRKYAENQTWNRSVQDRYWFDSEGQPHKRDFSSQEESALKRGYSQAVRKQEQIVKKACARY
jgi:hypothetical protein